MKDNRLKYSIYTQHNTQYTIHTYTYIHTQYTTHIHNTHIQYINIHIDRLEQKLICASLTSLKIQLSTTYSIQ
jgi:hypothetical protein